ncbi:Rho GTPase-activating protein 3 [Citrus sinensis]|uniref:rho GTPase-activating protein 3 n=1 Tax=Citrus sinensis TaxID=2711 RepID=UPI0003D7658E|nr:rho GTPase-activating protein 3 [Citrus sinensis]KAH9731321.1 Rho GTPase-activating protein 3 [Citrus sinensis]
MTRHFRSKSCGFVGLTEFNSPPPSPFFHHSNRNNDYDDEEEEEFECDTDTDNDNEGYDNISGSPLSTPFIINPGSRFGGVNGDGQSGNSTSTHHHHHHNNQFQIRDILVAALRKSLVTCSVEGEDEASMDISWPTEVRHVSHVTFDRFNGFLGLPTELEPEVPRKAPSASVSVFGVSAKSMQCSYDDRGNSVPTILLMMQRHLYSEGGLKAEGIFRINAENSQEEYVRDQLNKGVVPHGIDVHCLAGLIKAWLRELPTGVLDSLTPDQVMHCNTEEDCTQLVKLLPPSEAALLDWAINLMADVVQHEQYNKMNARNIAMVFAPNMTQMADPLTALIHAVQVMNFLKTLILKILREREEAAAKARLLSPCSDSPNNKNDSHLSNIKTDPEVEVPLELTDQDSCTPEGPEISKFSRAVTLGRLESDAEEKFWNFHEKSVGEEDIESVSDSSKPALCERETGASENGFGVGYNNGDWLSLRRGVRRLCRHPLFQLGKPAKKTRNLGIVNTEEGGEEETCA